MIVLFEKMAMLVILLALGYLCARMKLVGPEFNKGLSKIVMNLFLVAMILSSVINKDMELSGSEALTGFLMLTLMVLICLGIGFISPTVLRIKDGDRGMYRMLVSFMNNGFMGFPLVAAIYGDEVDMQLEYAGYYSGEGFAELSEGIKNKFNAFGTVTYAGIDCIHYLDGNEMRICLPIPGDAYSYILVTVLKHGDCKTPVAELYTHPEVGAILDSIEFGK